MSSHCVFNTTAVLSKKLLPLLLLLLLCLFSTITPPVSTSSLSLIPAFCEALSPLYEHGWGINSPSVNQYCFPFSLTPPPPLPPFSSFLIEHRALHAGGGRCFSLFFHSNIWFPLSFSAYFCSPSTSFCWAVCSALPSLEMEGWRRKGGGRKEMSGGLKKEGKKLKVQGKV